MRRCEVGTYVDNRVPETKTVQDPVLKAFIKLENSTKERPQ